MLQIHKVIDRLHHYVMMSRNRRIELIEMWEKEKDNILQYYKKNKHKSSQINKMRRQLVDLSNEVRDTVLKLYMKK